MKKLIFIIFLIPLMGLSQDSTKTEMETAPEMEITEHALRVVPLITSSPLLGLGVGAAVSYLYYGGDSLSSKSQLSVGGQYSVTESITLFANNRGFFNSNKTRSNTFTSFASINNEFTSGEQEVSYNIETLVLSEVLMFQTIPKHFLGGFVSYKQVKYDPNNSAGAEFIMSNGIIEEYTGGFGFAYQFDTRENKYYPRESWLVTLAVNTYPEWLGANRDYYQAITNFRYYANGFRDGDVWAWQVFGQFSSKETTDNGLPTLSGKSLLRGFPAGQYKALYMTGAQSEYRYQIPQSKFRIIAFVGIANLAGGSYGDEGNSRDDDGWYEAGGLGMRYAIQQKTGVDLRLDVVYTSTNDKGLYLKLNQAF